MDVHILQNQGWEEQPLLRKSLKFRVTGVFIWIVPLLLEAGSVPWMSILLVVTFPSVSYKHRCLPWILSGHMIVWVKQEFQPKEMEVKVMRESFSFILWSVK